MERLSKSVPVYGTTYCWRKKCWTHLISRPVSDPLFQPKCPHAIVSAAQLFGSDADALPTKDSIRKDERRSIGAASSSIIPWGVPLLRNDGSWRVEKDRQALLWISDGNIEMKGRLLIPAHLIKAEHHGVEAIFQRSFAFCFKKGMPGDLEFFAKQYLFCADYKSGRLIPRTYAGTARGTDVIEALHFNYFYVGPSEVVGG